MQLGQVTRYTTIRAGYCKTVNVGQVYGSVWASNNKQVGQVTSLHFGQVMIVGWLAITKERDKLSTLDRCLYV